MCRDEVIHNRMECASLKIPLTTYLLLTFDLFARLEENISYKIICTDPQPRLYSFVSTHQQSYFPRSIKGQHPADTQWGKDALHCDYSPI